MDEHYAESLAVSGMSPDTEFTVSVRLGRFPPHHRGTLWLSAYVAGENYAVTAERLDLPAAGPSNIGDAVMTFEVAGSSMGRIDSEARHTAAMQGTALAVSMAHRASHPTPGEGDIPIRLDASFAVSHLPAQVRPGRMEVMGRVAGTLVIGDRRHEFDMPGKWHEQVGARPRFAPAFTYLFVQGEGIGIMATMHADRAWGYVLENGVTVPVTAMSIDPYGANPRRLTVTLQDGRRIAATAHIKRETSVPIEGQRRPGATVVVDCDLGPMCGALNDWNPAR